jgi:CMP-N-acetylneuraminic acid synthetase
MRVCVIPAKKKSVRFPNKNVLNFNGKQLFEIAARTALDTNLFDVIILSSDSNEILETGSKIPGIKTSRRDIELTKDSVRADDVVRFETTSIRIADTDLVCCLLPTTPLLQSDVLRNAIISYRGSGVLFGIVKSDQTPYRAFTLGKNQQLDPLFPEMLKKQSNDYPETYCDAGQFYIANKSVWDSNYSITAAPDAMGILLASELAIDLNTPADWNRIKLFSESSPY